MTGLEAIQYTAAAHEEDCFGKQLGVAAVAVEA